MSASDKLKRRFDTQDYANFDFLSYVVWLVPEKSGAYSYGLQYLQLLTEPIPRILWGGKPVGPPVKTGVDLYAYANFNGLTVSMAGRWLGDWRMDRRHHCPFPIRSVVGTVPLLILEAR
jgi:hypothetical protein